ncbi:MAG: 60S ribosomal protein L31 [Nanoarchaeota archaeon]|nr:60S ribosomal protein L31 [Nanoarchaeota archaeon]
MERTYNIPLRKEFQKAPPYKKSKKAVTALKEFLKKHMKSDDIIILKELNEAIWARGIKNPPHHVKVIAKKEDGKVIAQLFGQKLPEKEKEKKDLKQKVKEKLVGKKEKPEHKAEKAEPVEQAKPVETAKESEKPVAKSVEKPAEPAEKPK